MFAIFGIVFQSPLSKKIQNLKDKETVIFDKVLLKEGHAYDKRTGKFTATVEGVYSFNWKTLTIAGKYFITEIAHNGNTFRRKKPKFGTC